MNENLFHTGALAMFVALRRWCMCRARGSGDARLVADLGYVKACRRRPRTSAAPSGWGRVIDDPTRSGAGAAENKGSLYRAWY